MKRTFCKDLLRLLPFFVVLAVLPVMAWGEEPYPVSWLVQEGSTEDEGAVAITADGNGSVFVTGRTTGVLEPGQTLNGRTDTFVARFAAATGELVWLKQLGLPGEDEGLKIVADKNGNLFVAGDVYTGTSDTRDVLLIKLTAATGEVLWVKQLGTVSADDWPAGVALDGTGNVLITGTTTGSLETGKPNAGSYDFFLARFSAATGDLLWTRQYGGPSLDVASGIAIDGSGGVFITGETQGALQPGVANAGSLDAFLVKVKATTGDQLWVRQFGSAGQDRPASVAVDNTGNAFVTGYTDGNLAGAIGGNDGFLAAYSPGGDKISLVQFGTSAFDTPTGVAVDGSGSVFVAGYTTGSFPGQENAGSSDIFLAKFNRNGDNQWVEQLGTSQLDQARDVTVDASGNVYEAGGTRGNFEAGDINSGGVDIFVVRFNAVPTPLDEMKQLIADFEKGVAEGTITANTSGNSDIARKNALSKLRKMLELAEGFIADGKVIPACQQLEQIYKITDGAPQPPDVVVGSGVDEIAADVLKVRSSLACR